MTQKTLVLRVAPGEQAALEERLRSEAFEWRAVPHARFSVKGGGVVATLYRSGKLVVQGPDPEAFVARFVGEGAARSAGKGAGGARGTAGRRGAAPPQREPRPDVVTVGTDECGKGDYLGPLVVAAARLTPEEARRITETGVVESGAHDAERVRPRRPAAHRPREPVLARGVS